MNSGKKKGLGRGLSALFGDQKPKEEAKANNQSKMISTNHIGFSKLAQKENYTSVDPKY